MTQAFQQTEGIILKAIPFREEDAILSLFTQEAGVIKLFCRGARSPRKGSALSVPLTQVEVIYKERASDLFSCQEMRMIHSFFELRGHLLHLEVASDFLRVILSSQLIGKPAPQLYALLCYYLRKIPQIADPWVLATSFRLKLIKHEGLAPFPLGCGECLALLEEGGVQYGENWRCQKHPLPGGILGIFWTKEELDQVYRWANCQHYREICSDGISLELRQKLVLFFEDLL